MNNILITGDNEITVDGKAYKIVSGRVFKPGYDDFAPRVREDANLEEGQLLIEFGVHRLTLTDGEVERVKSNQCNQYIVAPSE